MKTEEDEAFEDIERRQGGFHAKRQAAMDKINAEFDEEYIKYREAFPKGYTSPQPAQEPIAYVTGTHNGRFVVAPLNPAMVLPVGMALYTAPSAAQPAQEPVAWITPDREGFRIRFSAPTNDVPLGWDALYTTPPKRKWVKLTDEETRPIVHEAMVYYGYDPEHAMLTSGAGFHLLAESIEQLLKEKNT